MKDAVSGEPMIGVSVRVKGTGSGTITDFDGNFTVKASKGDILVISYVGYKTLELDLKNKTTLGVISLGEDTETLEEVVVVGYGVQKKVSSEVGFKGICKKVAIFCLVGIGHVLDTQVIQNGSVLRTAVIFFYLSNEGISIIENVALIGLPVPKKLKEVLEQLHEEADEKKEDE